MVSSEFLNSIPLNPGVYIMKNKNDKIIYIGKAKVLRNRVKQYFQKNGTHTAKVLAMVSNIDHIEYILTNSEIEALNLECSLIKKHRPKYNILLKDDKGYPYIKITNEEFPRILLARKYENDGAKYFGPYISAYMVKQVIALLRKIFMIRECGGCISPKADAKPCLNFHIKRCTAPCTGNISREEYAQNIKDAASVLSGNVDFLIEELEKKMNSAAENLQFEAAAEYRDKISGIKRMSERQLTVSADNTDEDIVYLHKENDYVCVQMMFVRGGRLVDKKAFFMNNGAAEENSDILYAFLMQHYSTFASPKKISVSHEPADKEEIEKYLSDKRGSKVALHIPKIGDKVRFMEMAEKNAAEAVRLKEMANGKHDNTEALLQLKEYTELDKLPSRIEAYDISNTSGEETTGSMVVFINGLACNSQYRKFKIKAASKKDDYAAMQEMIRRRFERVLKKNDEKFASLPDLILADGGKGHVNAVEEVLKEIGINIPVMGIVKDNHHKTRDIVSAEKEFNIPIGTKCFKLAADIQDEMHRVAITYHRYLREKKNLESEIMTIPGIGRERYKKLMSHFKTINALKGANADEIAQVKGISRDIAENIVKFFKKN